MDLQDDQSRSQTETATWPGSTSVASATYSPDTLSLEVEFVRNGAVYMYQPVTPAEWADMQGAPSVGLWVRQVLRGRESAV